MTQYAMGKKVHSSACAMNIRCLKIATFGLVVVFFFFNVCFAFLLLFKTLEIVGGKMNTFLPKRPD